MLARPCAKINLGLNIVGRRADGYHDLETVFYPIPLCDELRMEMAEHDTFSASGMAIGSDEGEENLVVRAVNLLRQEGLHVPPLSISLVKNIPTGAGLGGGSSDAAFTVTTLNHELRLGLSPGDMRELVSRLGADCPFFVDPKPVFAEGIGNVFTPVDVDLRGWHLVLVKPDDFVSTKEAYAGVSPHAPQRKLREVLGGDIATWRDYLVNDFEATVFPLHPSVERTKAELYKHGAIYASMSGSGSSVYGLFPEAVAFPTPFFRFTSLL